MAVNGLSVGHDATIILYNYNTRQIIATANVTDYDEKAEMTEIKSRPLSGLPIYGYIPEGWKGSFTADRTGRAFDDLVASMEASYYAGVAQLAMTISRYVAEPDGTQSQYNMLGVVIKPEDLGTWKGDAKVSQKFSWAASTRVKVK